MTVMYAHSIEMWIKSKVAFEKCSTVVVSAFAVLGIIHKMKKKIIVGKTEYKSSQSVYN